MLRRLILFLCIVLFGIVPYSQAQQGTWNALLSQSEVRDILIDNDEFVWAVSSGGLFSFDANSNEILSQITPLDGLYQANPVKAVYNENTNTIWLSYSDGVLQSYNLNNDRFQTFTDIQRADRFAVRGINAFQISGNILYIATDFGLVLFDTNRGITLDTYFNIGSLSQGSRIFDFVLDEGVLYLATTNGIAVGNEAELDLNIPSNWTNYDGSNGFQDINIDQIKIINGIPVVRSPNGISYSTDGFETWEVVDIEFELDELRLIQSDIQNQRLFIVTETEIITTEFQNDEIIELQRISTEENFINQIYADSEKNLIYAGTQVNGIGVTTNSNFEFIKPEGPYFNLFSEIIFSDGVLIGASSNIPERVQSEIRATGFYRFVDGIWENYNLDTRPDFASRNFRGVYTAASSSDFHFFGSWGRGIAVFNRDSEEIQLYNSQNSPLRGTGNTITYPVISGMDTDRDGNLWLNSRTNTSAPLYKYDPVEEVWEQFNKLQGIQTQEFYETLFVDSNNQKWIGLIDGRMEGRGLVVLRTDNEGSQEGVILRTDAGQGNLPNAKINAVVEDRRGEIWIGTNRGIARFNFPGRVIDGSNLERQASLLINADPDVGGFLLRDANITAIAVDGANRKWVGTAGSGVWVIREDGGRYRVDKLFTEENSPLISDNIESIAIDNETGIVYIATERGLVSYTSIAKRPVETMDELFIYPNPYSYNRESGNVIIDELGDQTRIRIMSVDGRLIRSMDARGGRVSWDVLDGNGNKVSSGVYLIIATEIDGSQKGVGRLVIIQ